MVTETLELKGHILDSLILPKVLDEILEREGRFEILEMAVGQLATDISSVRLRVEAPGPEKLEAILTRLREQGAEPLAVSEAAFAEAPADGVFPDGFYVSTNFPTSIRVAGQWESKTGRPNLSLPRRRCGLGTLPRRHPSERYAAHCPLRRRQAPHFVR